MTKSRSVVSLTKHRVSGIPAKFISSSCSMPRNNLDKPLNPSPDPTGRDPRDDNESDNLLSSQHSNYGSVLTSRKPSTSTGQLIIVTVSSVLLIIAIFFYPTTQQVHDKIRRKWDAEKRDHQFLRDAWNSELEGMIMERERWRNEREDHENRQRLEEEGKRALIVWENPTPSNKCLRYGTKEYSAKLAHVPLGLDPLKECWKKSIDIHGRQVLPSRCDTQGMCGAVVGHWIVNFNEATCVTWWNKYVDKGCVERGIHRYESLLVNLQSGDDWREMCATTPGHIQGKGFDGPTSCASWWPSGVHGIWLIEDANCF